MNTGAVLVDGAVMLRAWSADDVVALLAAFADDQIARWNPGSLDRDEVFAWIASRNDWSAGDHASWAIGDQEGTLIGSVSLHEIDLDQRDAEIGYWTAPEARNRGVAVRAVRLALSYAFGHLDLHRVYLFHAVENLGSCAVAHRAGFRLEGELRRSYRYADGRYHDEHLHAVLSDEHPEP